MYFIYIKPSIQHGMFMLPIYIRAHIQLILIARRLKVAPKAAQSSDCIQASVAISCVRSWMQHTHRMSSRLRLFLEQ